MHAERLDLRGNSITGTIPEGVGEMRTLIHLDLFGNLLTESVPPMHQEDMHYFLVGSNSLTGTLPEGIGLWSSLVRLDLASNLFSGTVSKSFEKLSSLEFSEQYLFCKVFLFSCTFFFQGVLFLP